MDTSPRSAPERYLMSSFRKLKMAADLFLESTLIQPQPDQQPGRGVFPRERAKEGFVECSHSLQLQKHAPRVQGLWDWISLYFHRCRMVSILFNTGSLKCTLLERSGEDHLFGPHPSISDPGAVRSDRRSDRRLGRGPDRGGCFMGPALLSPHEGLSIETPIIAGPGSSRLSASEVPGRRTQSGPAAFAALRPRSEAATNGNDRRSV